MRSQKLKMNMKARLGIQDSRPPAMNVGVGGLLVFLLLCGGMVLYFLELGRIGVSVDARA